MQAAFDAIDLKEEVRFDIYYWISRNAKFEFMEHDEEVLNIVTAAAYSMWHERTFEKLNLTFGEAVKEANWMLRALLPKMEETMIYTSYSNDNEVEQNRSEYRTQIQRNMSTALEGPTFSESAMGGFAAEFHAIVKHTKRFLRNAGLSTGNNSMPIILAIMKHQKALNASLHRHFPNFTKTTREAMTRGTNFNAWNAGKKLVRVDGSLLMKAMQLNHPSLRFATLGSVYAHELFHTHFGGRHTPGELKGINCVSRVAVNACKKFGEKVCHSGPQTINEDGPDIEGYRLAYAVYKDQYRDLFNKQVFTDINMNVNQALFVAISALSCIADYEKEQGFLGDPHSALHVQDNIAFGHPEFKAAFNCEDTDPMIETEQCHVFGDLLPR